MFDRILLLLLILILPLGIIGSRIISGEIVLGNKPLNSEQEKKIDAFIQQVNQQLTKMGKPAGSGKFDITAVVLATESATLEVAGAAPDPASYLWIWVAGTRSGQSGKDATASTMPVSWQGPEVVKLAGQMFSQKIDVAKYKGVVEIKLEQGSVSQVVRFDLDKNKHLP